MPKFLTPHNSFDMYESYALEIGVYYMNVTKSYRILEKRFVWHIVKGLLSITLSTVYAQIPVQK
jgi:hypothetical protein